MRSIEERELVLNMYFREGKTRGEIAKELCLPCSTVKTWIHRYRLQNGQTVHTSQYKGQLCRQKGEAIRVKRSYKLREKSAEKNTEERIAQLEMEVDLLRNFLLKRAMGFMGDGTNKMKSAVLYGFPDEIVKNHFLRENSCPCG